MKLHITGRGTSGSWRIRGEQLGHALGATVQPMAASAKADANIVVKRIPDALLADLRAAGKPIIWDIVDAWPQPEGNTWPRVRCMEWLKAELQRIRPDAVIAATDAMRHDVCEAMPHVNVLWLPHHHRPNIQPNPIRSKLEVVGYEGSASYIPPWMQAELQRVCTARGARFVMNPDRLSQLDVVIALREATGYAPRFWKSGVKLANAHASGTPFIGAQEAGYLEIATGCEYWAATPKDVGVALDWLCDQSTREQVSDRFRQAAFTVEAAADKVIEWLRGIRL